MESLALYSPYSITTTFSPSSRVSLHLRLTSQSPSLSKFPPSISSKPISISSYSYSLLKFKPHNTHFPIRASSSDTQNSITKPQPKPQGAKIVPLIISVSVGLILRFLVPKPLEVSPQAWQFLAIFISTIAGLVLSPLPVGAWAFLGLTTSVLTKTLTFTAAFGAFTNEVIWLIVISFFFARGFVKTGLGDRIATYFVKWSGKSTLGLSYGLTISETLIAPAMPSTLARAGGVFLPIIKSLSLAADSKPRDPSSRKLGSYLIMSQLMMESFEATNLDDVDDNLDNAETQSTEPDSAQNVGAAPSSKCGKKRKKTSIVWTVFEELPISDDGKKRARCRNCGVEYISESSYGTGNMLTHMNNCVRKDTQDVGQLLLNQTKGVISLKSPKFDHDVFVDLVVDALIMHELPFKFVELKGIRAIFNYISPDLKLPCRNTAKARTLKKYQRGKGNLKSLLTSLPGRICLTSDLWSSRCTDGYLTLTAHFIDKDWKLNKMILSFCIMPPPHDGVHLCEKIYTLLREWGIEEKLFSITLDNATNNTSFVEILKSQLNLKNALLMNGKFFHVRCCCHIVNLIVQDGLKEIDEAVVKIRESIKYVKGSSSRKAKFDICVAQVSLVGKKRLRGDVPMRWNSTYDMLEGARFYQRAFAHLQLSDSNYKMCPSPEEWCKVDKIFKFLGVFYDVTCLFSGTAYPTANLYFPQVFRVQHTLKQAMSDNDSYMRRMGGQMMVKFEKYWSDYSLILAIAVILDPRYKYQFVEWAYIRLYGNESYQLECVRDTMASLFELYTNNLSNLGCAASNRPSGSNDSGENRDCLFEDFDRSEKENSTVRLSELQMYYNEPKIDRLTNLDILDFWRGEQYRYPTLSILARDVLSIPISTVASESAFSTGGRVLDEYRSSLLPENVQALICTRDWIFGKKIDDNVVEEEETNGDTTRSVSSGECSNTIFVGN